MSCSKLTVALYCCWPIILMLADSASAAFTKGPEFSLPSSATNDPFFGGLDNILSKDPGPAGTQSAAPQDPFSAPAEDVRLPNLLRDIGGKQAATSRDPFDSSDSDDAEPGPAAPPKRQFKVTGCSVMH